MIVDFENTFVGSSFAIGKNGFLSGREQRRGEFAFLIISRLVGLRVGYQKGNKREYENISLECCFYNVFSLQYDG